MNVLHFRKELSGPPAVPTVDGVFLRPIALPGDLAAWLALRERAVADLRPGVRAWGEVDFFAELAGKAWWRAERCWVAVAEEGSVETLVGAVTLGIRFGANSRVPVVHWLLVDAAWRRRGVGRLLISQLERAAWEDGWREVQLETHAGWQTAVAFYQSMGYAPLLAD